MQGSELRSCYLVNKATKEPVESITLTENHTVTLYGSESQDKKTFIGWSDGTDARIGIGLAKLASAVKIGSEIRMSDGACHMYA